MRTITSIFLALTVTAATAQPDLDIHQFFPIEASHSYVGFQIKYMGYAKVRGRFSDVRGTVRFDPKDPSKTSATISIGVESLDTDLDFRDNDLKSDNWFGAKTYPRISFESLSAQRSEKGVTVEGNLTIKSTTRKIKIDLETSGVMADIRADKQIVFVGTLTLDRTDFGVEGKNWSGVKEGMTAVANEVMLEITILGKQIGPLNFANWVRNPERPQGKIYEVVTAQGVTAALAEFDKMREVPDNKIGAGILNTVGYKLLLDQKFDDAKVILKKNIDVFPNEGNPYDTYGELLATQGQWSEAKKYYLMSLEKDPGNMNAKEIVRHIK